jgi:hypothetical protein
MSQDVAFATRTKSVFERIMFLARHMVLSEVQLKVAIPIDGLFPVVQPKIKLAHKRLPRKSTSITKFVCPKQEL